MLVKLVGEAVSRPGFRMLVTGVCQEPESPEELGILAELS